MAYTRIHNITTTLNKALAYIENPDKTDELILVSGYNVDPLTAAIEFEMTAALAREIKGDYTSVGGGNNLAHHMIQSFAPYDKITPEGAHELGKKWADEILQGQYEYVITTHVDKGHIHNHIIFNSTSFYDYKKFENYKVSGHLREISDRLCAERGLYVIKNPKKQKSMTHYEWAQKKSGVSWKAQVKDSIDRAIARTNDYDGFKAALLDDGIEILEGARITFHKIGVISKNGRAAKCRGDKIGEDYTRERIIERLAEPKKREPAKVYPTEQGAAREQRPAAEKETFDKRVEWEARKTKLAETKELAACLLTIRKENVHGQSDFEKGITTLQGKSEAIRLTIKILDEKNIQYKTASKYLLAYNQYLPVYQEWQKTSKARKGAFEKRNAGELAAFRHAAEQLNAMEVGTNVDPEKVIALVREQDEKVKELSAALQEVGRRISGLRKAREIVNRVQQDRAEKETWKRESGPEL